MKAFLYSSLLAIGLGSVANAQDTYRYSLNLEDVSDDQLTVSLNTPTVTDSIVEFHIPKIVPGTYSISDFGRFVSDFSAYDAQGNLLTVDKLSTNRWSISDAQSLAHITYTLDDSFDTDLSNVIFEPAGTNFEAGDNFVLNTHGIFGYLEGYKDQPFELSITRPADFYGATALEHTETQGNVDTFSAPRYFELADAPIMYCLPDTATVTVGGAEVMVSVYSPNDMVKANFVREQVTEVLRAQEAYLGGKLPVNRYAFLIYLFNGQSLSGSYGALEHSYSSLYFLPEVEQEIIAGAVRDIASHEFFHIVTPLNIHSEEIGNFDFINPKMSQHLWLYEGVTEYSSHHAQVSYGITELSDFLEEFRGKIITSRTQYQDDLPFTTMSKEVLEEYEDEYGNVYEKGALIGFCLDIRLRQWSEGEYGIQNLMQDLSKSYGKEVSFVDNQLFDKIAELTAPEIKDFLTTYVDGPNPLPLEDAFGAIGVSYISEQEVNRVRLGVQFNYNQETERIFVANTDEITTFGEALGLQVGDEVISVQKKPLTIESYQEIFEMVGNTRPRKKIRMVVARPTEDGEYETVRLKARAIQYPTTIQFILEEMEKPSAERLAMRNAWLGK